MQNIYFYIVLLNILYVLNVNLKYSVSYSRCIFKSKIIHLTKVHNAQIHLIKDSIMNAKCILMTLKQ